ncbi:hypothetical protein PG990_005328 [Apiospora arundinis]|uniref:Uncharacterized protein n=1 Tax=Apiospora arundinis TaxID=335852 RepID=A0ABR2J7F6_9PEZI
MAVTCSYKVPKTPKKHTILSSQRPSIAHNCTAEIDRNSPQPIEMQLATLLATFMAAGASASPIASRQFGEAHGNVDLYSGSTCDPATAVRPNFQFDTGCVTLNETYGAVKFNSVVSRGDLPVGLMVYSKPGCNLFYGVGAIMPKMCSSDYAKGEVRSFHLSFMTPL